MTRENSVLSYCPDWSILCSRWTSAGVATSLRTSYSVNFYLYCLVMCLETMCRCRPRSYCFKMYTWISLCCSLHGKIELLRTMMSDFCVIKLSKTWSTHFHLVTTVRDQLSAAPNSLTPLSTSYKHRGLTTEKARHTTREKELGVFSGFLAM